MLLYVFCSAGICGLACILLSQNHVSFPEHQPDSTSRERYAGRGPARLARRASRQGASAMRGFRVFFCRVGSGHGSPCVPNGRMGAPLGVGSEVLALNSYTVVQATTSLEMGLTEPRVAITRSRGGWTTSSISAATGWGLRRSRMRW